MSYLNLWKKKPKSKNDEKKKEIVSDILFFIFIIIFLKTIILIGIIKSESMEPTLNVGNIGIYNGLTYTFIEPRRGDIILFKHNIEGKKYKITKRIIGLPGETISFDDGKVYIDGKLLIEDYIKEDVQTVAFSDYKIPSDAYFVMGDNRENSWDSRFFEDIYIDKQNIIGKLLIQIPKIKLFRK